MVKVLPVINSFNTTRSVSWNDSDLFVVIYLGINLFY